ncbi:DMT family transporter [Bosea sp. PAMC 26642]|uniref:DMT family transporter n=1 Tax=Bosea sp. (strain PAMC 26642) TaxID=1792307 RepID=UPI00143B3EFA|nr:DMT family transporter [Bosea sp. PAMC 26642]
MPLSSAATARARRRTRLAIAGMLLTVLIFGSNFVVSRYAVLNGLTQYDLLALRFATAGLLLLPIFLKPGLAACGGVGWKRGLLLALTSGFPMTYLMLTGLTMAPAAHGATIGPGTVTLIGIIGSVVLFGAVLSRMLVLGIVGVLAGLACLGIAGSTGATSGTLRGDLCFLGVGLLWGFYPLMIQLWKVEGLKAAAIVSVLSMAYLPFYAVFFFRGFDIAPWWVLGAHALYQGVVNVIVGLWIWGWASHVLGAAVVGRFPPLIPVTGTLLAIPVLGEIPGPLQVTGFALIIGGLFVASWRRPARASGVEHQGKVPADADAKPDRQGSP